MRKLKFPAVAVIFISWAGLTQSIGQIRNAKVERDRSGAISLDSASHLISNFLSIPVLNNIGKKYAVGGTIDTKYLLLDTPKYSGILFWYCFNLKDSNLPKLFLSWEPITQYSKTDIAGILQPTGGTLLRPNKTIIYTENGIDKKTVKKFVSDNADTDKTNRIVSTDTVSGYKESFKAFAEIIETNPKDISQCKYPYSYFDYKENKVMRNFLKNNPYAVRYYFGYDSAAKPNKIRVILMTVDSKGANILGGIKDGGGGIVETSWPPPPGGTGTRKH